LRTPIIDIAVEAGNWPPEDELRRIAEGAVEAAAAVLAGVEPDVPAPREATRDSAISILFTDDAGMQALNARWRGKDRPTNVLSFPQAPGPWISALSGLSQGEGEPVPLGDIALAAETIRREAALAEKPLEDHIPHLIIHGLLHLLGYDHEAEDEAEEMEQLERAALSRIGIADPTAAAREK
jgi:probable rRNA maturation factor